MRRSSYRCFALRNSTASQARASLQSRMLLPGSNSWAPSDWSRDHHSLVYTEVNPKTGADIWLLADPSKPSAELKSVPLLRTPATES